MATREALLQQLMQRVSGRKDWAKHPGYARAHKKLVGAYLASSRIAPLKGASLNDWMRVAAPLVRKEALKGGAEDEDDGDGDGAAEAAEAEAPATAAAHSEEAEPQEEEGEETGADADAEEAPVEELEPDRHDIDAADADAPIDLETAATGDAQPAGPADLMEALQDEPEAGAGGYDEAAAPEDEQDMVEAAPEDNEAALLEDAMGSFADAPVSEEAPVALTPAGADDGVVSEPFKRRLAALHSLLSKAPEHTAASAASLPAAPDINPSPAAEAGVPEGVAIAICCSTCGGRGPKASSAFRMDSMFA